jgi:trehalose 6-phosphate phosphatase
VAPAYAKPVAATGDALLGRLASAPDKAGILLDFDGVLAPIVPLRADAAVPPETRAELRRLAGRYALVGVISGRSADDVRARLDLAGVAIVGSHGLELSPQAAEWQDAIDDFAAAAAWPPDDTEVKGPSVTFHYRAAADEASAVAQLEELAARAAGEGLVARFGRKVLEVLPPVDANKGTAVRALLAGAGLTRALVAGDDSTDLDAFAAVDDLDLAVRVAVLSDEAPPELRAAADIAVSSTAEFLELLRQL